MPTFIKHDTQFAGSEIMRVDLQPELVERVRQVGQRFIDVEGADIKLRATTDRCAALDEAAAMLTTFRPGGLEARVHDEMISLKYGLLGPVGLFMEKRSLAVFQQITAERKQPLSGRLPVQLHQPSQYRERSADTFQPIRAISLREGPAYSPAN